MHSAVATHPEAKEMSKYRVCGRWIGTCRGLLYSGTLGEVLVL